MKSIFAIIALLSVFTIIAEETTKTPYGVFKTQQELRAYEEKVFNKSNRHNFELSGYIVDDEGVPVSDVKMEVILSNNVWSWRGSKYTTSSEGDKFELSTPKCRSASIQFTKKGYYSANVSAGYLSITKEKLKYNFQYDGSTIKADGIKVEMVKRGKINSAYYFSGALSTELINENNKISYKLVVIYVPGEGFTDRDKLQNGKETKFLGNLPKNFIYMTSNIVNGEFEPEIVYIGEKKVPDAERYVPKSVILKTNDPKGGFVLVPNAGPYQLRRMKEAPVDGYKQQIELSGFQVDDHLENRIFLYFKVNNHYGKLLIESAENMKPGDKELLNKKLIKIWYTARINPFPNERKINTSEPLM